MTEVALIRPGTSEFDRQGRMQGQLRVPLCDEGRRQVSEMVEQLRDRRIEVVYAAASEPAGQTAALLAEGLGIRLRRLDALTNVDLGLWEGCQADELRRKHPKVFRQWEQLADNVCPPQGETLGEVRQRVEPILERLLRRHRHGKIALVAPNPLAGLIAQSLELHSDTSDCGHRVGFGHWDLWGPASIAVTSH
jgi:probable phosphoglycerate mutase